MVRRLMGQKGTQKIVEAGAKTAAKAIGSIPIVQNTIVRTENKLNDAINSSIEKVGKSIFKKVTDRAKEKKTARIMEQMKKIVDDDECQFADELAEYWMLLDDLDSPEYAWRKAQLWS